MDEWRRGGGSQQKQNHRLNLTESEFFAKSKKIGANPNHINELAFFISTHLCYKSLLKFQIDAYKYHIYKQICSFTTKLFAYS